MQEFELPTQKSNLFFFLIFVIVRIVVMLVFLGFCLGHCKVNYFLHINDSFVFTLVTAKLYPLKNMPISFVDLKTFREGILMFLSATSTHTSKFVVRKKIFVEF